MNPDAVMENLEDRLAELYRQLSVATRARDKCFMEYNSHSSNVKRILANILARKDEIEAEKAAAQRKAERERILIELTSLLQHQDVYVVAKEHAYTKHVSDFAAELFVAISQKIVTLRNQLAALDAEDAKCR